MIFFIRDWRIIFAVTLSMIIYLYGYFFIDICWNERRLKNLRERELEYIFWNMILPLRVNIYSQIFFWSWYTCCSCIWYMSSQNASSVNNLERSRTIANGTTTSDDESSEISFPSLFSHSLPKKPWRCYYLGSWFFEGKRIQGAGITAIWNRN